MAEVVLTTSEGTLIEGTRKEYAAGQKIWNNLLRYAINEPSHLAKLKQLLTTSDITVFYFEGLPFHILKEIVKIMDNTRLLLYFMNAVFDQLVHALTEDSVDFKNDADFQNLSPTFYETRDEIRGFLKAAAKPASARPIDVKIKLDTSYEDLREAVKDHDNLIEWVNMESIRATTKYLTMLEGEEDDEERPLPGDQ